MSEPSSCTSAKELKSFMFTERKTPFATEGPVNNVSLHSLVVILPCLTLLSFSNKCCMSPGLND